MRPLVKHPAAKGRGGNDGAALRVALRVVAAARVDHGRVFRRHGRQRRRRVPIQKRLKRLGNCLLAINL